MYAKKLRKKKIYELQTSNKNYKCIVDPLASTKLVCQVVKYNQNFKLVQNENENGKQDQDNIKLVEKI